MIELETLARSLSVTTDALESLGITRSGDAWLIPERDATGAVIGQAKRRDDGTKGFVKGGRRGLTYAHPLKNYAGSSMTDPIFIVEGMSDVSAGLSMGLDIVGRPSATGGADLLAELLKDRHACIIAENDSGPGQDGARKIAEKINESIATLRIISPPSEYKDLRSWYAAPGGAINYDVLLAAAEAEEYVSEKRIAHHAPHLIRMADVEPSDIRWLWPGRIPLGRLTLLVGRPGDGKSFLTANLAANVSKGQNWIDGSPCPKGSVVLCSAEDDPADTIAPRLIAHGADRQRIHLLSGVLSRGDDGEEVERVFTLADLPALRQTLKRLPDCKLIVVDPIGSYLGGQADAHRDNEVRGVLAPVCQLAAQHGAAVVVVAHTRKASAANADDMAMGSRAFTGLARSVLHLMIDPDDLTKQRRLLLPGKNNLAERPAGLAFDIGPGEIEQRPCVRWMDGEVTMTADEAVNRDPQHEDQKRTERDEAADWLRQTLAEGPMLSKEVQEQAKEGEGIAKRTLDRAKKAAGVVAYRPENPGPWYWRLPDDGQTDDEAERHTPKVACGGALAFCPDDSASGVFRPE